MLVKILLGLQKASHGTVEIMGSPSRRGDPRVGYVPQKHAIDQELSTESIELVRLGLSGRHLGPGIFSRNDQKVAMDALRSVGAEDLAHHSLGSLSGESFNGSSLQKRSSASQILYCWTNRSQTWTSSENMRWYTLSMIL